MKNILQTVLLPEDAEFVMTALNQVRHDAVLNLQRTNLGDIERKNYEYTATKSKELMDKLKS